MSDGWCKSPTEPFGFISLLLHTEFQWYLRNTTNTGLGGGQMQLSSNLFVAYFTNRVCTRNILFRNSSRPAVQNIQLPML